jgi:peroxiredoxin
MNRSILLAAFLIAFTASYAQNPEQILKASYAKCNTISNGYYDMHMRMKFMDLKDTSWDGEEKFYFNKLKKDSVYSIAFNSELFSHGHYVRNILYTGNAFVTFLKSDSTGKIMEKSKWANKIKDDSHNYFISFYSPFTSKDCYPIPQTSDYNDGKHFFSFLGKEAVNDMNCFHVQMVYYPKFDSSEIIHSIKEKRDYWINNKDMLPVKYSIQTTYLQYGDTLSQYESLTLKNYLLNNPKNLEHLQLSAIPSYCKLSEYTAAKRIKLLAENTLAPAWSSISPERKPVTSSDYKGKIVLTDFFYKDCYPCMKAIPALESLYHQYKSHGLQVIGIDPVDSLNNGIKHFILKAGITYPVVIDEIHEIPKNYHVSGYPTLYLTGKDGKVLFAIDGYDESVEAKLEKIIKSNL